ncbi:MAG: GTP 3',8-cyclase MoaA [Candidatus Nitrosopolaris sp.]
MIGKLVDGKGRIARKLRISVTDKCNFACLFCMPHKNEVNWIPQQDILSFEEIIRITKVLCSLGIVKVRITGGEPLLRKGIEKLVRALRSIDNLNTVDMTTNGWFLAEKAKKLREAGLQGVTVSLHSLRPDRFERISGKGALLSRVLDGIDSACDAGLYPIKINTVAIRGYNDDEIIDIVEFARKRNLLVKFIEFMPLDGLGIWSPDKMVSGKDIIATVSRHHKIIPLGRQPADTTTRWGFEDGKGELGVITPMTEPFCDDCDRIRLSADGKLLTCLFDINYYDLKQIIRRNGCTNEELAANIVNCVLKKPPGVAYMPFVNEMWKKRSRGMNAIGG